MSGGSYNRTFYKIEELAYDIMRNGHALTPERKAFCKLLVRVSEAAKAIEWNDSGDGDSREDELIKQCLGEKWKELCMIELIEDAKKQIELLTKYTQ